MATVNKVIIVGRLGHDPEVRQFQNGGGVTNISVATSESWTDKMTGERKEQTEWHRVALFNRLGEIAAQYLRKGSLVYIEGSLNTRKWQDQQGIERQTTEIRATNMTMLGDYGNSNNGNNNHQNAYGRGNTWNTGREMNHHQGASHFEDQGYGQNAPPRLSQHYPNASQNPNMVGQTHQPYQTNNFGASYTSQSNSSNTMPSPKSFSDTTATMANNQFNPSADNAKAVTPPSPSGVADDDMPF